MRSVTPKQFDQFLVAHDHIGLKVETGAASMIKTDVWKHPDSGLIYALRIRRRTEIPGSEQFDQSWRIMD